MRVVVAAMTGMGNAAVGALRRAGIEVVAVITDPVEGPGFPHYRCEELIDFCLGCGVPVWAGVRLSCPRSVDRIMKASPDAFVIATSKKIVSVDLVDRLEGRAINCHPSLLPRHRGPTPVQWTVECGDRETGLTFIRPIQELDAGPIWYQHRTAVDPRETAGELRYRLDYRIVPQTLPSVVEGVVSGRLKAAPQSGPATREGRFVGTVEDVDWARMGMERGMRRFRARTPYPGVYLEHEGSRYRVARLAKAGCGTAMPPGTVTFRGPGRCVVQMVDGTLLAEVSVEIGEPALS